MSEEDDSSQEKTEDATPRRLEKAREEGQIPRSRELNTMAVLMAGATSLLLFGQQLATTLEGIMRHSFSLPRDAIFDLRQMAIFLLQSGQEAAWALLPFFGMMVLAALVGPAILGGWLFSGKALAPKFNRLNPLEGIKRMFSAKSLVELAKAVAKVALVLGVSIWLIKRNLGEMFSISREAAVPAMAHVTDILSWSFLTLACTMILIAAVDVPYQLYEHNKKLKMTKQQIKDEYKDSEGKPEVKGRIRQLQREMAQRRMMADVPQADVVITNPTHYSVALKYDAKTMDAPVVLAKGGDEIAMKIREIAREHKVEIISAPPLARSIYHHTKIGEEIPSGLYVAVAQILAYVFQLRQYRRGRNPKPRMPDLPIPNDLKKDE
ncbi:MAG: flagellar type III secretion system protein FlhB [Hahellaceae bacterium]|nr:flagellar type III secretion system protein FlhB [Hahellaceae bacterium]